MEDKNEGKIPAEAMPPEETPQDIPQQEPVSSLEEGEPVAEPRESMLSQESIDNVLKDIADGKISEEGEMPRPVARKADFQQLSSARESRPPQNIDLLMDVDLPVSIELGRTKMSIADILALGPGSVVELDKLVGEPVDLLVNQKCVARGEVVVVEENFGLRITQLMPPEERIKNLR